MDTDRTMPLHVIWDLENLHSSSSTEFISSLFRTQNIKIPRHTGHLIIEAGLHESGDILSFSSLTSALQCGKQQWEATNGEQSEAIAPFNIYHQRWKALRVVFYFIFWYHPRRHTTPWKRVSIELASLKGASIAPNTSYTIKLERSLCETLYVSSIRAVVSGKKKLLDFDGLGSTGWAPAESHWEVFFCLRTLLIKARTLLITTYWIYFEGSSIQNDVSDRSGWLMIVIRESTLEYHGQLERTAPPTNYLGTFNFPP